jgi:hypothetical protein
LNPIRRLVEMEWLQGEGRSFKARSCYAYRPISASAGLQHGRLFLGRLDFSAAVGHPDG